jgi:hypothetical protein
MIAHDDLSEYLAELREHVCSRCIERVPGGPPCMLRGKSCGIELHVSELVRICRTTDSVLMDPYIERLHDEICADCPAKDLSTCPCPLDYLLQLAVEAVENVERRRIRLREPEQSANGHLPPPAPDDHLSVR